ncbi:discoidin domain-containing protein [Dyadobacter sp. NIV53]|uniref:discoidin domain-containing protein n=1 Tax=Dyadobacter sp. NIV53 TaxID=2861765 RepID=UPI001E4706BB|nr:discoidin domain-containing protein [Dyadobacter sp. NIV53]
MPLRKGWFYHPDQKPKTPEKLFDLYFKSVGRGAGLDLGLAPDTRGQLHADDVAALKSFGDHVSKTFATNLIARASSKAVNVKGYNSIYSAKNILDSKPDTYWATDDDFKTPEVIVELSQPVTFDIISLQEYIKLGQRIEEFAVDVWEGSDWKEVHKGTSVGAKRLVKLAVPVTGQKFRLRITKSPVSIAISEFGLYKDSE